MSLLILGPGDWPQRYCKMCLMPWKMPSWNFIQHVKGTGCEEVWALPVNLR